MVLLLRRRLWRHHLMELPGRRRAVRRCGKSGARDVPVGVAAGMPREHAGRRAAVGKPVGVAAGMPRVHAGRRAVVGGSCSMPGRHGRRQRHARARPIARARPMARMRRWAGGGRVERYR